ncbi:MAG: hypothetical protein ACJ76A_05805 [Actinomycetota bacterium]
MSRWRVLVATVVAIVAIPGVAFATWTATGNGRAYAKADLAPTGARPSVTITGRNAAVSWTPAKFTDGTSVQGYTVRRYDATTGTQAAVGAGCAGLVTTLTCTEAAIAPGTWWYTVTPVHHNWTGTESPQSLTATVASPSLTLTGSTTLTSLPGTLSGTIASFVTGNTVTWRLDNASTGTVLTGSITPSPVPASGSASASITIPNGTADGTHTLYAVGSGGASTASATFTVDALPPVIGAAVIQKSAGGSVGAIRPGGTYRVYASITDAGSAISSATTNVTNITAGTTAAALTAGSWTLQGVAYNYRSAVLTAGGGLTNGAKTFSITATDSNAHTATTGGFSVTVDNSKPSASSLSTTNKAGGTVGKAETGDGITFTYSEPMDPSTILAGWDGTASTSVTVRLLNANGGGGDRVQVWDATNTTQLDLGTVRLGSTGYTTTSLTFTNSTMTVSGNAFTIVLGTPSAPSTLAVVTSNTKWTPSNAATDLAGNACQNTASNEAGAPDPEF